MSLPIALVRGVGTDITSIPRVNRSIARFGKRFLLRAFSDEEIALCAKRLGASKTPTAFDAILSDPQKAAPFFAARWAAKEALIKAVGDYRFLFPEVSVLPLSLSILEPSTAGDETGELALPASMAASHLVKEALQTNLPNQAALTTPRRPEFTFRSAAADYFDSRNLQPFVSLSHEQDHAIAFVVLLERQPAA
jgi:holo-[acyl-carrier protein] synthase